MKKESRKALKELRAKKDELEKKIQQASKELFAEASKELFSKHPTLKSFSWTQYTPYFNDGDECNFNVYNDEPEINNDEEYYRFTYKTNYNNNKPNLQYDKYKADIYKDVQEFLLEFSHDDYKLMFGDHCKVTITRDGAEVIGYSHD